MRTSDLTNELDTALCSFAAQMPVIKKDVTVKMNGVAKSGREFNVNYDYAPLESIQEIANPLLAKHGLNVSQHIGFEVINSEIIPVIHTRVAHLSGQYIVSTWPLDMSGVTKEQDRGSKITFNKRYAFVAALNIALSNEDNDAVGVEVEQKKINYSDLIIKYSSKTYKNKKVTEVEIPMLQEIVRWWENDAKEKPTGNLYHELENIKAYINKKTQLNN